MLYLILPQLALGCNYPISPGGDCIGSDTRTVLGEFGMVWVWIPITFLFFFGFTISVVRDIIPRPDRTDNSDRYFTGESRNLARFFLEEYLLTGWFVTKFQKRFTNTSRWCLITTIIYTDMLITGLLYQRDYSNPDAFQSRDFVFGMVSTAITFSVYLIQYLCLVIRQPGDSCNWRHFIGYGITGAITAACLIFVFVFTYKAHDDTNTDHTNLINHWLAAFGYALLLEMLVSENVRLITRGILIWTKRFDPDEPLPTLVEQEIEMYQRPNKRIEEDY